MRGLANQPPRFFKAPAKRFNAEISTQRPICSSRVPLHRVKAVTSAFGVKLSDAVLALVSGAIRRYLLDRGELPDRPLVAQVPVSTHGQRREIGSQISSMTVSLATNIADPADRMKTIHSNS